MLPKKLFSAFFSSSYFVLILSSPIFITRTSSGFFGYNRNDLFEYLSNIWSVMFVYFMYTFIIVLVYGIGVSVLLELVLRRLGAKLKLIVSGILHTLLGALGGLVFMTPLTMVYGGSVALMFFIIDAIYEKHITGKRMLKIVSLIPLLWGLFSFGLHYPYWYIQDGKYTAEEAVKFVVAGAGTYESLFPDERTQTIETRSDGYRITRTTDIEQVGKGNFRVKLIERWEKEGVSGEHTSFYRVQRKEGSTSSWADGSTGDIIPFRH
ncbi:hypothetical protein B5M42_018170 [Paenibacillus athensensis]|uniref:Uncharacterized protein n=1 Tax=Paenibacillus athensensis TaxID=1967502 RepID=A0A4Y8Q2D2_9BACL|nr:hypothetical protein [Paenibacillus athensensis]MCD1260731.1 hypothetical protein [Paenibacillus athensensis]